MKKITRVPAAAFLAAVAARNLPVNDSIRSCTMVSPSGTNRGPRIYIAKGKTVGWVHLSGFTHRVGKSIPEHKRPTSQVQQELDLDKPEAEILSDFGAVLDSLAALVPAQAPASEPLAAAADAPETEPSAAEAAELADLERQMAELEKSGDESAA
jgi:hypothetical protein